MDLSEGVEGLSGFVGGDSIVDFDGGVYVAVVVAATVCCLWSCRRFGFCCFGSGFWRCRGGDVLVAGLCLWW